MRKPVFLLFLLLLGLAAGCGVALPSPTPSPRSTTVPTSPPLPTSTSEASSSSVSCVAEPFDLPVEPRIPPITEKDRSHGPADASITVIEYADFQ